MIGNSEIDGFFHLYNINHLKKVARTHCDKQKVDYPSRTCWCCKSYIPQYRTEPGHKVMNAVPTNNQKQEWGKRAMTMNNFFGGIKFTYSGPVL